MNRFLNRGLFVDTSYVRLVQVSIDLLDSSGRGTPGSLTRLNGWVCRSNSRGSLGCPDFAVTWFVKLISVFLLQTLVELLVFVSDLAISSRRSSIIIEH